MYCDKTRFANPIHDAAGRHEWLTGKPGLGLPCSYTRHSYCPYHQAARGSAQQYCLPPTGLGLPFSRANTMFSSTAATASTRRHSAACCCSPNPVPWRRLLSSPSPRAGQCLREISFSSRVFWFRFHGRGSFQSRTGPDPKVPG